MSSPGVSKGISTKRRPVLCTGRAQDRTGGASWPEEGTALQNTTRRHTLACNLSGESDRGLWAQIDQKI